MNIREISASDNVDSLLNSIPFYKAVKKQNERQFNELMQFSRIVHYESGEKVISRGSTDTWTYFLVKGQLVVSVPDFNGRSYHVNYITPGEVFGDLSVLLKDSRTADVYVDDNCKEAIVFGTDFGLFGQLINFNLISLETKLLYYRHTNHSLRWKLEMYRSKYRDHPMSNEHRKIMPYTGPKDNIEELHALYHQTVDLARLLVEWNKIFGNLSLAAGAVPEPGIAI